MGDDEIIMFLGKDFSQGTEAFRDELLARCLAEIDAAQDGGRGLTDDELDMLAAAGDMTSNESLGFDPFGDGAHL